MTPLSAANLTIGYGTRVVARGLSLRLEAGTVTCLLGPNGVGKTTLFKTLLGLLPPLAGTVRVADQDTSAITPQKLARAIAYVPQAAPSAFAFTVLDLVLMGRTAFVGAFATPSRHDVAIALAALERLGIADLADRDANRISGGQRQLALVARALAQQAAAVIMDEPTASLDLGNRVLVLNTIQALAREGLAILVSTHEPEQAFAVADAAAVLGRADHFEVGPVAALLTSETLTRLYGTPLLVERTPSGRFVVGPDRRG